MDLSCKKTNTAALDNHPSESTSRPNQCTGEEIGIPINLKIETSNYSEERAFLQYDSGSFLPNAIEQQRRRTSHGIETLTSSPTPSSSYSQRTRVANQTVCKFVFSDVPNPQILKEFSGRTLTCKLCLQSYSDLREFNLHVYDHLRVSMNLRAKWSSLECKRCKLKFKDSRALTEHNALEHLCSLNLYSELVKTLEKTPFILEQGHLGESFTCDLCDLTLLTIIGLLEHLADEHLGFEVEDGIKDLRCLIPTRNNVCPYPECRKQVKSNLEVTIHVGVDHLRSLQAYLRTFDDENEFQQNEFLDQYYLSMMSTYKCIIDPSSCQIAFDCRTALNIHICYDHFDADLQEKFTSNSKPIKNSILRECNFCQFPFKTGAGGAHLGIVHDFLSACLSESSITLEDDDDEAEARASTSSGVATTSCVPVLVENDKEDDNEAALIDVDGNSTSSTNEAGARASTSSEVATTSCVPALVENDQDQRSSDDGLEKPLTCHKCRTDFQNMDTLIDHVKTSNHEGAVLTCKFCETFSFTCTGTSEISVAQAFLCAHVTSSDHLHNRFIRLHKKERVLPRKENLQCLMCELCSSGMDLDGVHIQTDTHKGRYIALLLWVEFCDLIGACPITCEISQLKFFLQMTYPKTLTSKQTKVDCFFLEVLMTCLNLHHSDDIESISKKDAMLEGITCVFPFLPNFICFQCKRCEVDLESFLNHLEDNHITTGGQSSCLLKCEPCNTTMVSATSFSTHVFTSRHLVCTGNYNNTISRLSSTMPVPPPNFCSLCSKQLDENDNEHINSQDHQTRVKCALKYIAFCARRDYFPPEIETEPINDFFIEMYRDTPKCRIAMAHVALEVLNALHMPIDGYKLNDHSESRFNHKFAQIDYFELMSTCNENFNEFLSAGQIRETSTCPICSKYCFNSTGMVFHASITHDISTKELLQMKRFSITDDLFQCSICERVLKSLMSYALHVDKHKLREDFCCKNCKTMYPSLLFYHLKDKCGVYSNLSMTGRRQILDQINMYIVKCDFKSIGRRRPRRRRRRGVDPSYLELRNERLSAANHGHLPPQRDVEPDISQQRKRPFTLSNEKANSPDAKRASISKNSTFACLQSNIEPSKAISSHDKEWQLASSNTKGGEPIARPGMDQSYGIEMSNSAIRDVEPDNRSFFIGQQKKKPETSSFEKDNCPDGKSHGFCIDPENCQLEGCNDEDHELRRF